MRAFLLDEIGRDDMAKVRRYLGDWAVESGVTDLYWIELPEDLRTADQAAHEQCQPHRFAVELGEDFVRVELLIRPSQGLRCHCAGYADERQRAHIIAWTDRLVAETGIQT